MLSWGVVIVLPSHPQAQREGLSKGSANQETESCMLHLLDYGTTLAQFFIHLRSPFPVYKIDMLDTAVGGSDSFERCIHCGLIHTLKNCVCNVVQVNKNPPGSSEVFSCGGKKKKLSSIEPQVYASSTYLFSHVFFTATS